MKKLMIGVVLATVTMTAFAQVNTVKKCQLTEWCPLERPSDFVQFSVSKNTGPDYDCVLSAEGTGDRAVTVVLGADNNYQAVGGFLSVPTGQSRLYRLQGSFNTESKGTIDIRRADTQANVKKVFVKCEKAFA